jgi:hypothetical protein
MTAARASFEALASLGKSLPSSPSGSSGDASKSKHSSLPLASSASPPPPPLQKTNSVSSLTKSGSNHSLTRTVSASSLSSHADTPTAEKRLSVTRADNVTVSFVGGKPQPRHGALRLKRSSLFASFRDSFVSVDNGEISFADNELEMNKRETYSLLEVREVKLVNPGSNQFALKLGSGGKGASKTVSLKCDTPKEAADWIAAIHHELRNQVLVCQQSVKTLQEAGHSVRLSAARLPANRGLAGPLRALLQAGPGHDPRGDRWPGQRGDGGHLDLLRHVAASAEPPRRGGHDEEAGQGHPQEDRRAERPLQLGRGEQRARGVAAEHPHALARPPAPAAQKGLRRLTRLTL